MGDSVESAMGAAIWIVGFFVFLGVGLILFGVGVAAMVMAFLWAGIASLVMVLTCLVAFLILRSSLWNKPAVLSALEEGRQRDRPKSLIAQDVAEKINLLPLQIILYLIAICFCLTVFVVQADTKSLEGILSWGFRLFAILLFLKLPNFFLPRFKSAVQAMAFRQLQIVK